MTTMHLLAAVWRDAPVLFALTMAADPVDCFVEEAFWEQGPSGDPVPMDARATEALQEFLWETGHIHAAHADWLADRADYLAGGEDGDLVYL